MADPLEVNPPKLTDSNVTNIRNAPYSADNTGQADALAKINQAITDVSAKGGGIIYFPSGLYKVAGKITMKNNVALYLAGGANLRGMSISFSNAKNAKIYGRGVLDRNLVGTRTITGLNMSDITLEGFILMRQPGDFHIWLQYGDQITIRNLKLVGETGAAGNDGINHDCCQYVTIDDCFVYSGDDCTSPKIYGEKTAQWQRDVNFINTTNLVGWNNSSGSGFKTFEAYGTNNILRNMTFENIDIVNAATDEGLGFYAVGGGGVDNLWLKNIRVERLENKNGAGHRPLIIASVDWNPWGSTDPAYISNVYLQNVDYQTIGSRNSQIYGRDNSHLVSNVTFDHLTMAGSLRMSAAAAQINIGNYTSNIAFQNNNRSVFTITATQLYAAEGGTKGQFTITRSGATDYSATLYYRITGTATNGVDYKTLSDNIIFPAGVNSQTITVDANTDAANEKLETVVLELVNKERSNEYMIGPAFRAVVVICEPTISSITASSTLTTSSTVTGLEDDLRKAGYLIYPNPAQSYIVIQNENTFVTEARLVNAQGEVVKTIQIEPGENQLPLETLPVGVYLLHISNKNDSITHKIIKI